MQRISKSLLSYIERRGASCILRSRAYSNAPATTKSSKPAGETRVEFDLSRLSKPLQSELEFNRDFVKDQELEVKQVQEKYAKTLQLQDWTVHCEDGSTEVFLKTERNGMQVVVRFDAELVAECVNSGVFEDEDAIEDAQEEEEEEENSLESESYYDEDDEYGAQPYNYTVELHRTDVLPDGFVEMEVECNPATQDLYINSVYLRSNDKAKSATSYAGPSFESLDESLREKFDKWAVKNLAHLTPFIAEFSQAKEAEGYAHWLNTLKRMSAPKA